MQKDEIINFRVDSDLKNQFQCIVEKNGYTISKVLNACMMYVVKKRMIPINYVGIMGRPNIKQTYTIHDIKEKITAYIDANYKDKIEKIYLFGSYSRGEEKSTSDIDLHLFKTNKFNPEDYGNLCFDLQKIFGKEIDVVLDGNLNHIFLNEIRKDEICIYEQR